MPHSLTSLSDELETLAARVWNMGGLTEGQVADAIEAIERRDNALAARAVVADGHVDQLEAEIEHKAIELLSRRQPFAKDLRECVAAIKIATDLERIGDLAKNIAKRTIELNAGEPIRSSIALAGMGRQALLQLNEVLNAYTNADLDLALSVWGRDRKIDDIYNSMFRELLDLMAKDPRTIGPCTHLMFVAKNIERIGDHATNIAETVYYLIKGEPISKERPKGDQMRGIVALQETVAEAPGPRKDDA